MKKVQVKFSDDYQEAYSPSGTALSLLSTGHKDYISEEQLETLDGLLSQRGLQLEAGWDINGCCWVAITRRNEHIELRPFEELDWQAFAGAEGEAHIGYFNLSPLPEDDEGWQKVTGGWTVIADDNGVGCYFQSEEGDSEVYMAWYSDSLALAEAKEFVSKHMRHEMTPQALLACGFEIELWHNLPETQLPLPFRP